MKIHPDTIAAVRDRLDIVEIISDRIPLKRRGKSFLGLCPFHNEKTASLSVNPSGLYHCFGCSVGGDAIKFVMEFDKLSFPDAILHLARQYQVPVQTLEREDQERFDRELSEQEQIYEILALAAAFFSHALGQEDGIKAREHLRSRRIQDQTIAQFQLGYAPMSYTVLGQYLVAKKGKPTELVEKAGLIKPCKHANGFPWLDVFRDRLMIPICDEKGRVVGFGGRALAEEQNPKYLNSCQTLVFDKSRILFGLDKAKEEITRRDRAIVVEGYFDVIALHQAGINNVVASCGTSLTTEQVQLLLKHTESNRIVFSFDNDSAGIEATRKAISKVEDSASNQIIEPYVLVFKEKDAHEFLLNQTAERFRQLEESAPSWIKWELIQAVKCQNLKDDVAYKRASQNVVRLLGRLSKNPPLQIFYTNEAANLLAQGNNAIVASIAQSIRRQLKRPLTSNTSLAPVAKNESLQEEAESILLRVYLHCPDWRDWLIDRMDEAGIMFSCYRQAWQTITQSQASLLVQELGTDLPPHLIYLNELQCEELERTELVIETSIAALKQLSLAKERQSCLRQYQSAQNDRDRQVYWQRFCELSKQIEQAQKQRHIPPSAQLAS